MKMSSEDKTKQALHWILESIGTSNLKVNFKTREDNLEGFMADTLLAEVILQNGEVLYLFIKIGRMNLKSKAPIVTDCSKREIYFYRNVVSSYQRFLQEKNLSEKDFLSIPKCYKTFLSDTEEVIVLEDIKPKGYQLFNRHLPMNLSHIKMVLTSLAKLHSISFALKAQKQDEFAKLTENYSSLLGKNMDFYRDSFNNRLDKLIEKLQFYHKNIQADKVKKLKKSDIIDILQRIINDNPQEAIVLHGDSHNNNFLFQYKDSNTEHPSKLIMVDFQLSFLHSPVIDLSYFWHFVASTQEYPHLTELLEFYHKELSTNLNLLGCNSDELFSLDTLWTHWKKYSLYGFIQAVLFTYLLYVDHEDLQKINDGSQGTKVQKLVGVQLKNDEAYVQRISALIDYYKLD
ncbi:uncharacterized protein LOC114340055 [Diabrotica virgifera virgifera]|uniref:Uncharacterized protein LOC114340055 n=1 Tax=Diabrotica virgifera virgifera TaxID=50390 RepID=A0A6P7GBH5_DIAVI|nr:uncharacterized protein LOC114340055 [Diabrotica virgifera virgifera]